MNEIAMKVEMSKPALGQFTPLEMAIKHMDHIDVLLACVKDQMEKAVGQGTLAKEGIAEWQHLDERHSTLYWMLKEE